MCFVMYIVPQNFSCSSQSHQANQRSHLGCYPRCGVLMTPIHCFHLGASLVVPDVSEIGTIPTKNSSDTNRTWQGGKSGKGARIRSNMVKHGQTISVHRFHPFRCPHLLDHTSSAEQRPHTEPFQGASVGHPLGALNGGSQKHLRSLDWIDISSSAERCCEAISFVSLGLVSAIIPVRPNIPHRPASCFSS